MTADAPLGAALEAAARLGPVLPCCWPLPPERGERCGAPHGRPHPPKSIGKAPLTPHGVDDASADPERIRRWWARHPAANVALALEPSGLLLVDPDSEAARAEAAALGLPPTLVRISENPAYIYKRPPDAPIARTTHRGRSRAIDVMTSGYVLVHGRHRSGRAIYLEWLADPEPPPVWALDWLHEAVACPPVALPTDLRPVTLASLRVPDWVRRLIRLGREADPESYPSRSEALWTAVRMLIQGGHSDATIAAVVLDPSNEVGAKAREQGRRWLAGEISRARVKPPRTLSETSGGREKMKVWVA